MSVVLMGIWALNPLTCEDTLTKVPVFKGFVQICTYSWFCMDIIYRRKRCCHYDDAGGHFIVYVIIPMREKNRKREWDEALKQQVDLYHY